jgi:stage II sporulation protein D
LLIALLSAAVPGRAAAPAARGTARDGAVSIQIGLVSDLQRFVLPCCGGRVHLSVGGGTVAVEAPLTVEPAAAAVEVPEHRLQVAALKDQDQAEDLAGDLEERSGWPADVRFDAASGLYRVRLGRFDTREAADAARDRVAALGLGSVWVAQEGGGMTEPALRVRAEGRSFRVLGRWLAIEPGGEGAGPLDVRGGSAAQRTADGRYRGRLLLFLNDRGSLNLINELTVEEYLRGVVPKELGPELYPRLEALKAQTVAARTYALRHLDEFRSEGFDLCAGVRCQVYGGMDAEHPLSDRAVAETEGQILLWRDELVEAYYSATCGGHTEDAEVIFPWLRAPYLRGVPCPEAGTARLEGALTAGTPFPAGLTRSLVPPGEGSPREVLEGRLRSIARAAGLPLPDDRLASLERREVRRFVRSVFDLVLDPDLLAGSTGGTVPPRNAGVRLAGLIARGGTDDRESLRAEESEWLVLKLARLAGLLEEQELRYRTLLPGPGRGSREGAGATPPGPILRARTAHGQPPEPIEIDLTPAASADGGPGLATFLRLDPDDPRGTVAAHLELAPGDRLTLYRWRGRPRALVQETASRTAAVRRARLRTWSRFRSDSRLAELVGERFPGLGFSGLEILSRGVSGRVGAIRLLGEGGRSARVEGLAVRWTLDLPDTRFDARRVEGPGAEPGWMFTGGGWGHGVGMCQIGAYEMAGRGLDYREILAYYYNGARLGRVVVR